jgi:signal transduction histidine kinase
MRSFVFSFYSKLSLGLVFSFIFMGIILLVLAQYLTRSYQNEVEQKLHQQLAAHVVHDNKLLKNGEIDHAALKNAFHSMMILGPSFEFYILGPKGEVKTYSADPLRIKKQVVDIKPIQAFINNPSSLPILGDDPRSNDNHKIFSAAPIFEHIQGEDILQGYLYIIIGGEIYDGIVDLLQQSHILSIAAWSLAMAMLFGLLVILILFALLTRPLRRLTQDMQQFRQEGFKYDQLPASQWQQNSADEIERLGSTFNEMASTLNIQYQKVKNTDELRRELISYVSHDLRTPLASLQGYLETWHLKNKELTLEEGEELINVAMKNAQHMSRLIEQLFELAHLDSETITLNTEPLGIAEFAQDVLQKMSLEASNKKVSLDIEPKDPSIMVMANIEKLESVFTNLIDNALRHCEAGDSINIELLPSTVAGQVSVCVKDTGLGISEKDLPLIFDAHFKASNSVRANGRNSGLGLAISKRIIELHGSKLKVESTLGKGTQFSFDLKSPY